MEEIRGNNMRFFIIALAILLSAPAYADPGVGAWLDKSGVEMSRATVNVGGIAIYQFSAMTNSQTLHVQSPIADLCFDAKTDAVGGTGDVNVYRLIVPSAVDGTPITGDAILIPAIVTDNSDCQIIVAGEYWIEPTATDTPSATVTITGRSS